MMNLDRKKCQELDLLFTIDWQKDETALAKTGSSLWPM